MKHRPLAFLNTLELPPPTADDRTADAERLRDALELSGLKDVYVPLPILRRLPEDLRKNDFRLSLVMGCGMQGFRLLDFCSGPIYGIALDIGTTTVECELFDLSVQKGIGHSEIENPQISLGADILSRAQMAIAGRGQELSDLLRDGVNSLIASICEGHGIAVNSVYALTVSGNTIMSHMLLGLDIRNIPVFPNTPAVSSPSIFTAEEACIRINPAASVYVFPNAGSYVGGDIISGMLHTGIYKKDDPVLFMDVGTNVEITLGCRDWIMVGAGAAGPALEGGVADIGKKAEKGTVSGVEIDRETGLPRFSVIGGGEPQGICGSGLIDLVSELYRKGIIDQAGRFNPDAAGVVMKDGVPAYRLYGPKDRELLFTEHELQNFLRSKAAMFAFLYVFLQLVGMKIGEISEIHVAGALGCGINMESAVNIGMLPDIPRERIIPEGNTSLKGASMLLADSSLIDDVELIRSLITYREMSEDPDLLNVLQGALFIPHTNPEMLKG